MGYARLTFERDGRDWPNREASRFVQSAGLRWHVQVMGQGPPMLLLHGTGASNHTWRDLAPILARKFTLVMPDLPGHAFTGHIERARLSLPGIGKALAGLMKTLDCAPQAVVGHSAGAAILAQMCIDKSIAPRCLISLNGAFLPFEGLAGLLFPPIAKLMYLNPLTPRMLAWTADVPAVTRLIRGTGSNIDARGLRIYAQLMASPAHISGTLGMMSNWDLDRLSGRLGQMTAPALLLAAQGDRAVPPDSGRKVARRMPAARFEMLPDLGHLAHEEAPERAAALISGFCSSAGVGKITLDHT
jgi:magnesium chelatase accessory protein